MNADSMLQSLKDERDNLKRALSILPACLNLESLGKDLERVTLLIKDLESKGAQS